MSIVKSDFIDYYLLLLYHAVRCREVQMQGVQHRARNAPAGWPGWPGHFEPLFGPMLNSRGPPEMYYNELLIWLSKSLVELMPEQVTSCSRDEKSRERALSVVASFIGSS